MTRIRFVMCALIYCISNTNGRSDKYEAILENMNNCLNPNPPYNKKPIIVATFNIRKQKNKVILSGRYMVLEEVPFLNFSLTSYNVGNFGKEDVELVIENVSCQSWMGKTFLTMGNFRYYKKDCRVRRGTYDVNNIDLNTVLHSVPNYNLRGRILSKMTLVYNGSTVLCHELRMTVK
ncbi:uncharacterized protein LOC133523071 [Cydia pomonella]|uniref:uncharacterized protein LOC133523071 n=1 Tax=Cydia pomonella TaxID=82600 RepID=UPI002ADDF3AE|nr:uncharacterized protein LOC133523071 [Cydia pomonella]